MTKFQEIIDKIRNKELAWFKDFLELYPEFLEKLKGKDGENYSITEYDLDEIAKRVPVPTAEEIASKVVVPVVEKIIERTEVVVKEPIVTEVHKTVIEKGEPGKDGEPGSPDTGEDIVDKINSQDTKIQADKIEGLDKKVDDKVKDSKVFFGNKAIHLFVGGVKKGLVNALNIVGATHSVVNGLDTLTITASSSLTVVSVSGTYNATQTSGEYLLMCDASGGNVTVNLPTASGNTAKFEIHKLDSSSNTVTVDPASTELIKGDSTLVISYQFSTATIVSSGSAWVIV